METSGAGRLRGTTQEGFPTNISKHRSGCSDLSHKAPPGTTKAPPGTTRAPPGTTRAPQDPKTPLHAAGHS